MSGVSEGAKGIMVVLSVRVADDNQAAPKFGLAVEKAAGRVARARRAGYRRQRWSGDVLGCCGWRRCALPRCRSHLSSAILASRGRETGGRGRGGSSLS